MPVIDAVYKQGAFVPKVPVQFEENAEVRLQVEAPTASVISDEEFARRLDKCKTLAEVFALRELLPEDDGSYDLAAALRENRILTGDFRGE